MTKKEISEKIANDENKGRTLFVQVCQREDVKWCKVHKYAKNEKDPWDISFFNNQEQIIGEVKLREYTQDTFNDWYFEVTKLDGLLKTAKELKEKKGIDAKIGYINLFTNNLMCVWIFTVEQLIELRKTAIMAPAKDNSWDKEDVFKPTVLLSYGSAQRKEEIDLNKSIFNK